MSTKPFPVAPHGIADAVGFFFLDADGTNEVSVYYFVVLGGICFSYCKDDDDAFILSLAGQCLPMPLDSRRPNSLAFSVSQRALSDPLRSALSESCLPEAGGLVERAAMWWLRTFEATAEW